MHMKKNIPFAMLIRAIRYCSSFNLFIEERESLRIALLLNKYPSKFIQEQFDQVSKKFQVNQQISSQNYDEIRQAIIAHPYETKSNVDYEKNIFIHFTYCSSMRSFPVRFITL